jgi:hypothetical protein
MTATLWSDAALRLQAEARPADVRPRRLAGLGGVRTARHHFIDRCESTERRATSYGNVSAGLLLLAFRQTWNDLAPLRRGFRVSVPLVACNRFCGIVSAWVAVPAALMGAQLFVRASPPCAVQPTVRFGVEVVGLLRLLPETASPVGKQDCDPLSPARRGAFSVRRPSECRHRNQCASTSLEWRACRSCSEGVGTTPPSLGS